jgi:tetratricopeptide (TPR) repeat protein
VGAGAQGVGVLGALDPLADRQQGGELVAGPGRIPRLPGEGGEFVPGVQGVGVLGTLAMRIIRENLAASNSLTAVCQAAARLLDQIADSLRERWHQDRAAARELVEQITTLEETGARCPADSGMDSRLIRLRWWAAWFLTVLGVLGPDHPDTLGSRNNLSNAYTDAGRFDEALSLDEQVLAARERGLGPDHPDTLQSRNNLATAYQDAGRTEEAISLHEQVLAARERGLGPDHPDTLQSRNNLANACQAAGHTEEATKYDPRPSDP